MESKSKIQKKWKVLVDKWQVSGLTQKEFCLANDVSLRSFQKNKTLLKKLSTKGNQNSSKTKTSVKFLPVSVKETPIIEKACDTPIKIQINQYLVLISKDFDSNALKSLFQVINEL